MKEVKNIKGGSPLVGQSKANSVSNAGESTKSRQPVAMTGHYYNPSSSGNSNINALEEGANASLATSVRSLINKAKAKFLKTNMGYSFASAFGYKLDEKKYAFVPPKKPVKPQGPESEKYKKELAEYNANYRKYMSYTEYPGRPKDVGSRAYAEWYIKNNTFSHWKASELKRKINEMGGDSGQGYLHILPRDFESEFD